jgi:hypothetical protein
MTRRCAMCRTRRALCSCGRSSCRGGVVQECGRAGSDRVHPSAKVKPAPTIPRRCSPVVIFCVGAPRCCALFAATRKVESRPSRQAFLLPAGVRVCHYGLAGRTPVPSQSVVLLRVHAGAMPRAARVEATERHNLLFAEPWLLRCEGVCEVKGVAAHPFDFTRANPGSRPVASPPPEGMPAREHAALQGAERWPACPTADLSLGRCGPKAAHQPTEVQLKARDTKSTRGLNPRGTSELLPMV